MEKTFKTSAFTRVAEIKLTYRNKVKPCERPQVTCSSDSYNVLKESWDTGKIEFVEQFKVLLLNRANRVMGTYEVSTGGVAGTVADPKLIFAASRGTKNLSLTIGSCSILSCDFKVVNRS